MTVATGDVIRITVEGSGVGLQDIQNVWYAKLLTGDVSEATTLEDLRSLLEAMYALLSAILSVAWVIRDFKMLNITQNADVGTVLPVDATPGANVSFAQPPQLAYGLTLSTARLKARGRKFFGLVCADQVGSNGALDADAILDLADVGDYVTVARGATSSTWRFGIVSTVDDVFLPFTSYVIPTNVVTQRRRRQGVGE